MKAGHLLQFWLLVALAGCGLSVIGTATPPEDGGESETSDSGSLPMPADGGAREGAAALLTDGSADVSLDAGTGWCAEHPGHQACADFDEGAIGLTLSTLVGDASTIDPDASQSPPSSLLATGIVNGATTYAYTAWDAVPATIDLAFDALVTGSGAAQFGGIELTSPSNEITQLVFEANEATGFITFLALGPAIDTRVTSILMSSGWHHYEIHLKVGSGEGKSLIAATADGVPIAPPGGALTGSYQNTKHTKALVGLYYLAGPPPLSVNVDNVTIDGL